MKDTLHIYGNPRIRSYLPTDKTEIPPDIPINVDWQRPNPNDYFHNKVIDFNPADAKPIPGVIAKSSNLLTLFGNSEELLKYGMIAGGALLILLVVRSI